MTQYYKLDHFPADSRSVAEPVFPKPLANDIQFCDAEPTAESLSVSGLLDWPAMSHPPALAQLGHPRSVRLSHVERDTSSLSWLGAMVEFRATLLTLLLLYPLFSHR